MTSTVRVKDKSFIPHLHNCTLHLPLLTEQPFGFYCNTSLSCCLIYQINSPQNGSLCHHPLNLKSQIDWENWWFKFWDRAFKDQISKHLTLCFVKLPYEQLFHSDKSIPFHPICQTTRPKMASFPRTDPFFKSIA